MTAEQTALKWIGRGCFPVPIPYKSKRPTLLEWEKLRITAADAPQYFNGKRQNVGLLLGERNLIDVDLDTIEAILAAPEFLPRTACKFGRDSKPASHWMYYASRPLRIAKFIDPIRVKDPQTGKLKQFTVLELRGLKKNGGVGLQTVIPPSTHPEGERVRYERGRDGEPTETDAKKIETAVKRTAWAALIAHHFPGDGVRHDAFLACAGMLAKDGWNRKFIFRQLRAVYRVLWPNEPLKEDTLAAEVDDTLKAMKAGDPFTGFTKLTEELGMDPKVLQAANKWLDYRVPGRTEGSASAKAQEKKKAKVVSITEGKSPVFETGDDLLKAKIDAPPMVFEELAPGGELIMISGRKNAGKTTLALQAALAVSKGRRLFGFRCQTPGPVLYVSYEETRPGLKKKLNRLIGDGGTTGELAFLYHVDEEGNRLLEPMDEGGLEQIEERLAEKAFGKPYAAVVVDHYIAAYGASGGEDKNLLHSDYQRIDPLRRLAIKHKMLVMLLHHHRKAESKEFLDDPAGTIGVTAGAGALWVMQRVKDQPEHRRLCVIGRAVFEKDLELQLAEDGFGLLAEGEGDEDKSRVKKAIELFKRQEMVTAGDVANECNCGKATARQIIHRLKRRSLIKWVKKVKNVASYTLRGKKL